MRCVLTAAKLNCAVTHLPIIYESYVCRSDKARDASDADMSVIFS